MNERSKPTSRDISLYYDGLLDEQNARCVEAYLNEDDSAQQLMSLFQGFDTALQPDLNEDEMDTALGDTLTRVHEHLIQEERAHIHERTSVWDWLFSPRSLAGTIAIVLVVFSVFTMMDPTQTTKNPMEENLTIAKAPSAPPTISLEQKAAYLAVAQFAKSAVGSGVDYAKNKTEPIGEKLTVLPAFEQLAQAMSGADTPDDPSANESDTKESPASELLKNTGTRQIALGLGASMLTALTVF